MKQGSPEWFAARLGCVTASRVADVIAMTKNGPSERRNTYLYQLVAERLTGLPTETFVSDDMQRGIDMEAEARTLYELRADAFVFEMPFVPHPKIPKCGASPDGKVNADLLIEIKCPNTATHLDTLLGFADSVRILAICDVDRERRESATARVNRTSGRMIRTTPSQPAKWVSSPA